MATFIDEIRSRLRTGFYLTPAKQGGFNILHQSGDVIEPVRTPNGQMVRVTEGNNSPHFIRRTRSHLVQAGVLLQEQRSHSPREPNRTSPKKEEPFSPIIDTAKTTLADPHATPRERRLAKGYIQVATEMAGIKRLNQAIGQRLKELDNPNS